MLFNIIAISFLSSHFSYEVKKVVIALFSFFYITSIVTFVFSIVNISKLEKRINFKVYNFINLFGNAIMIFIYLLSVIHFILKRCSTSLCEVITDFLACIGLFFSSLCNKKEDNILSNPVSKDEHMVPKQEKNNNNLVRIMDEINGGFTYD